MSQRLDILRWMARGHSITPLQAFDQFNCLTLSQRVTELRCRGWDVKSKMVRIGSKRVAQYSLDVAAAKLARVAKRISS